MVPPAMVDESTSSGGEEMEYATPDKADQTPSSDKSEETKAGSGLASDNLAHSHTASGTTSPSNDPSPEAINGDTSAVDTAIINTNLREIATSSIAEVSSRSTSSNPSHSAAALNYPTASDTASPLSHNGNHPSQTRVPAPSPATTPATCSKALTVEKEVARLKEAIDEASPEALHTLLRQEWRVFLYTPLDEDHLSYILRVALKNSTPAIAERGIKEIFARPDYRPIVLKHALNTDSEELMEALPEKVLSGMVNSLLKMATANQAINFLSTDVKDEIVAHHLRNTPAKVLVNSLAKANRLGYSTEDIIDSDDELVSPPDPPGQYSKLTSGTEDIIMNETRYQKLPLPSQVMSHHPAINDPLLLEQAKNAEIQRKKTFAPCTLCGFTAPTRGGQAYHMLKKPCQTNPSLGSSGWAARCLNCGVVFITRQGQNYHNLNNVCSSGKYSDDAPTAPASGKQIPRPPFHKPIPTAPAPEKQFPRPPFHTPAAPAPASGKQIPRPPFYTPAPILPPIKPQNSQIQAIDPTARVNPSQLPPEMKAEMEGKIIAEDKRYQNALAALDTDPNLAHLNEKEKADRRVSLKNGNATKKSQIRKKYGVSLRLREKDKIALRTAALSSPIPALSTFEPPYVPSPFSTPTGFSPINGRYASSTNGNIVSRPAIHPHSQSYSLPRNGSQGRNSSMSGSDTSKYQNGEAHRIKRQRTSSFGDQQAKPPAMATWTPPLSRTQTPYGSAASAPAGTRPSIMEVNSDKKVPVAAAQARWEELHGRKNGTNGSIETVGITAVTRTPSVSNIIQEPIEIDSSSSDTDAPEPLANGNPPANGTRPAERDPYMLSLHNADTPVPTTEERDSESDGRHRPTFSGSSGARGKFTAKRGGRQSLQC